MSFLVTRLRNGASAEPTPATTITAPTTSVAPAINIQSNVNGASTGSSPPPPSSFRYRSKSPAGNGRSRSAGRAQSFPPAFPTPFHPFKLHPLSNKNQVNALKFIDRIDSLLFLGHTGQTVLAAIPPCMANSEAQAWYNRVMNSDIHRPSTIEEFRQLLINDHIWAFEQTRINSRYQTKSAANANRKDPYLESAEFKLHLAYIRDIVRLEEGQTRDEKKIAALEAEKQQLQERENTLQLAVASLQNEVVARNGGQPVPMMNRTNDILSNMKQLDEAKLKMSMLEQEKRAMQEKMASMQMKIDDMENTNTQMSNVRLQLQNTNSKNAELQSIIVRLEESNSQLQTKLLTAQNGPTSTSPPPGASDSREVQRLRKQNQQILDDLHQKEIRVHDLEAQVRSYSVIQQRGNDAQPAPQPIDRSAITNLEEIIKQKDSTIGNLHSNLNKLTDEAITRIQRVFQVEQLLLDSQLAARNKDSQLFILERKLQNLGHPKDCNCGACTLFPARAGSPDTKRSGTPEVKPTARVMSIPSSSSEISGPAGVSRTGTPSQTARSPPRFLDIKFKFRELYPSFLPHHVAARTAQLLQNGLTILHPGREFTLLWENIAKGLLETMGGDPQSLSELTRHMKLCFREREGESLTGLVVANVWNDVWSDVTGLDVVCDF
ncbi:hypothetical protein ABW19_dt0209420 [Dactylella cylindrospora]|nr:hypothetical protein ABW19_dt0209420 [Dactylella cylindrospora]